MYQKYKEVHYNIVSALHYKCVKQRHYRTTWALRSSDICAHLCICVCPLCKLCTLVHLCMSLVQTVYRYICVCPLCKL